MQLALWEKLLELLFRLVDRHPGTILMMIALGGVLAGAGLTFFVKATTFQTHISDFETFKALQNSGREVVLKELDNIKAKLDQHAELMRLRDLENHLKLELRDTERAIFDLEEVPPEEQTERDRKRLKILQSERRTIQYELDRLR